MIRRFLPPIPVKASLVIGGFLLLAYFPVWQPRFRNYRIFDFESAWKVLDFRPRPETLPQVSAVIAGLRETANGDVLNPRQIQDAAHNMDHFYQALFNLEQGDRSAVVRILHYGDSPTTADLITADARELLQQRFGDAGHGFLLIAQPWAWYGHRGFRLSAGGWMIDPAVQAPLKDGLYGIGGVSFRGDDGSWSQVSIRWAGPERGGDRLSAAAFRGTGGGFGGRCTARNFRHCRSLCAGIPESRHTERSAPPRTAGNRRSGADVRH